MTQIRHMPENISRVEVSTGEFRIGKFHEFGTIIFNKCRLISTTPVNLLFILHVKQERMVFKEYLESIVKQNTKKSHLLNK